MPSNVICPAISRATGGNSAAPMPAPDRAFTFAYSNQAPATSVDDCAHALQSLSFDTQPSPLGIRVPPNVELDPLINLAPALQDLLRKVHRLGIFEGARGASSNLNFDVIASPLAGSPAPGGFGPVHRTSPPTPLANASSSSEDNTDDSTYADLPALLTPSDSGGSAQGTPPPSPVPGSPNPLPRAPFIREPTPHPDFGYSSPFPVQRMPKPPANPHKYRRYNRHFTYISPWGLAHLRRLRAKANACDDPEIVQRIWEKFHFDKQLLRSGRRVNPLIGIPWVDEM